MEQDFKYNELADGFEGRMVDLPDILYPCWETRTSWRPSGYIAWFCIAPLFTFFVPLYMAAVYALKSSKETHSIDNALNGIGGPRRNSALARVTADPNLNARNSPVDHIPMSPTSARVATAADPHYQQDVEVRFILRDIRRITNPCIQGAAYLPDHEDVEVHFILQNSRCITNRFCPGPVSP